MFSAEDFQGFVTVLGLLSAMRRLRSAATLEDASYITVKAEVTPHFQECPRQWHLIIAFGDA